MLACSNKSGRENSVEGRNRKIKTQFSVPLAQSQGLDDLQFSVNRVNPELRLTRSDLVKVGIEALLYLAKGCNFDNLKSAEDFKGVIWEALTQTTLREKAVTKEG